MADDSRIPAWFDEVAELRRLVGELHEAWVALDPMRDHWKSSEGAISLQFDAWVDHYDTAAWLAKPPSVEVYSYVFGPGRMHFFDDARDAITEVRKWGVEFQAWLAREGVEWAGLS